MNTTIGAAYKTVILDIGSSIGMYIKGLSSPANLELFSGGDVSATISSQIYTLTPYFVCFNFPANPSIGNFVWTNLTTGAVTYSVQSGSATTIGNFAGSCAVGADSATGTSDPPHGPGIACAMMSTAKLSVSQLIAWAADPWSFWYPDNPQSDYVGVVAAAVTPRLRTMMGIGQ
jgi:hypothetical protein